MLLQISLYWPLFITALLNDRISFNIRPSIVSFKISVLNTCWYRCIFYHCRCSLLFQKQASLSSKRWESWKVDKHTSSSSSLQLLIKKYKSLFHTQYCYETNCSRFTHAKIRQNKIQQELWTKFQIQSQEQTKIQIGVS